MTRLEKTFRSLSDLYDFYQKIKNRKRHASDSKGGAMPAEKKSEQALASNQSKQAEA